MKKGIHPEYHEIKVVMTDGTEYITRSTYGEPGAVLHLDIDSKTHPAWDRRRPAPARSRRPRVAFQEPLQGPARRVIAGPMPERQKARFARAFFHGGAGSRLRPGGCRRRPRSGRSARGPGCRPAVLRRRRMPRQGAPPVPGARGSERSASGAARAARPSPARAWRRRGRSAAPCSFPPAPARLRSRRC
jgi:ribosomal protein L31